MVVGHPAIMAVPDLVALVWYREAWRGGQEVPLEGDVFRRRTCGAAGELALT